MKNTCIKCRINVIIYEITKIIINKFVKLLWSEPKLSTLPILSIPQIPNSQNPIISNTRILMKNPDYKQQFFFHKQHAFFQIRE